MWFVVCACVLVRSFLLTMESTEVQSVHHLLSLPHHEQVGVGRWDRACACG